MRLGGTAPSSNDCTDAACRARLSGIGDVHVRITVTYAGHDLPHAWIVVTPLDVMAKVMWNCRPGEMREMQRAYSDRLTLEIPVPAGGLAAGRIPGPAEEWTGVLTVPHAPAESSR